MSAVFKKTFSREVTVYLIGVWGCVASISLSLPGIKVLLFQTSALPDIFLTLTKSIYKRLFS